MHGKNLQLLHRQLVIVGDGEAETGPLATAWHSNKFLNAATDGAVLPILHLNEYKISNPTVFSNLMCTERTFNYFTVNYLRTCPALWSSHNNHWPEWSFRIDVFKLNKESRNFRIFGPDECMSNRLYDAFTVEKRKWNADSLPNDEYMDVDGRLFEIWSKKPGS